MLTTLILGNFYKLIKTYSKFGLKSVHNKLKNDKEHYLFFVQYSQFTNDMQSFYFRIHQLNLMSITSGGL